jgi:hypothetical protein
MPSSPNTVLLKRISAALFVTVLGVVIWGSLAPLEAVGGGGYDKLQHMAGYGSLTILGFGALGRRSWLLLSGVLVFGAGIEVLQAMMPLGRMGSLLDGAANSAGAALAWIAWTAAARLKR